MSDITSDTSFMQLALQEAQHAAAAGEVPVGAVVVKDGKVIATGRNAPIASHDPTAHAEIVALRGAAQALGNYRLDGCELFVTLEPCAMCSGAMLHSRLKRVVFGSFDAKTGAAGSMLNLFDQTALNHQTTLQGGVLGEACAAQLQDFFKAKREHQRLEAKMNHPLRSDALRTPDSAFDNLPGYPWQPNYVSDLPSLDGLRLHYLDEGKVAAQTNPAQTTYLCLHGNPAWSYLYRKMLPIFLASEGRATARVVAPDLIGFGKSDKPKKDAFHTFTWHRQVLLELIERLDLRNIVLVVQDWGGLLGLTLPMKNPYRFKGLLVMNTTLATGDVPLSQGFQDWRTMCQQNPEFKIDRLFARGNPQMSAAECAAYMVPFPDSGYRAATRAFPPMVPDSQDADGAALSRHASHFWQHDWAGQTLMAIGAQDPVLGTQAMRGLQQLIRNCPEPMILDEAGHFVQEQGEVIAQRAVQFFK
ncbi:MAG: tRNA adenosine(34) deaminase TadA [Burkholderiaceae bacterium]